MPRMCSASVDPGVAAPNSTLVMYPDGNHVCNNIAYKYRPLMADWMSEKLR